MEQNKIARINALARKAKTPEGLTPAETAERERLGDETGGLFDCAFRYLEEALGERRRQPRTDKRRTANRSAAKRVSRRLLREVFSFIVCSFL